MPGFASAMRSFWHTMTSNDRHASHDSPYRTGQHVPLNQSRHAPLTSVATSAIESRQDLTSPYHDDSSGRFTPGLQNGNGGAPDTPGAGSIKAPASPYSPGMRSHMAMQRNNSSEVNPFDSASPGEIQMQNFQEGLPPPPPVSHSWKRIDRWAEENYEELFDQLSEGATQNDVNELEHELDCSLPMEVRESLQYHDGQERGGRPTGIIFSCMLLDCEEIVQEWRNWRTVNEEYLAGNNATQSTPKAFQASSSSASQSQSAAGPLWRQQLLERQDSQPPRAIQKVYAHPGWIPLARDWGGNNLAVDLAPGPVGTWGQVIIFGRDYDCKYVVARSWSAFLATVADDLQSGRVFVDEDTQELKLREFKTTNVEPAYLDILRWRMDQKYGRKNLRKKPGPPPGPNSSNGPGVGSPYGSPTEERGRSPQRFPHRGPPGAGSTQSPRGAGIGRPSPLGMVTEENALPKLQTGEGEPKIKRTATAGSENLLDVNTPTSATNGKRFGEQSESKESDTSAPSKDTKASETESTTMSTTTPSNVTGLGVEGVDEMKNVEI